MYQAYLSNRYHKVRCTMGNRRTESHYALVKTGVPQGSVLGLVLFILHAAKILRDCNGMEAEDYLLAFADDHSLVTVADSLEELQAKTAERVNRVCSKMTELGYVVSPGKSNYFVLDSPAALTLEVPAGSILGAAKAERVQKEKEIRVLGVGLDNRLTMQRQVKESVASLRQRSRILYALRSASWGCTVHTMRTVIQTYALSKAFYAFGVWSHLTSDRQRGKLQVALNMAYRAALCAPVTTKIPILNAEIGLPCLTDWRTVHEQTLKDRVQRNPLVSDLLTRANPSAWVATLQHWEGTTDGSVRVLTRKEKKDAMLADEEEERLLVAADTLKTEEEVTRLCEGADLVIGADGTYDGGREQGACGIIYEACNTREFAYHVPRARCAGSYDAEGNAILWALDYLERAEKMPIHNQKVVLLTDSQSILRRIQSGPQSLLDVNIRLVIKKTLSKVKFLTLQHVKAHCGIRINEKADRAAAGRPPAAKAHPIPRVELQEECPTCLEDFGTGEERVPRCYHRLHRECSEGITDGRCPLCRGALQDLEEDKDDTLCSHREPNRVRSELKRQCAKARLAALPLIDSVRRVKHYCLVTENLTKKLADTSCAHAATERLALQLRTSNSPLLGQYRRRFLRADTDDCPLCFQSGGTIEHLISCPWAQLEVAKPSDLLTADGLQKLELFGKRLHTHPLPTIRRLGNYATPTKKERPQTLTDGSASGKATTKVTKGCIMEMGLLTDGEVHVSARKEKEKGVLIRIAI